MHQESKSIINEYTTSPPEHTTNPLIGTKAKRTQQLSLFSGVKIMDIIIAVLLHGKIYKYSQKNKLSETKILKIKC